MEATGLLQNCRALTTKDLESWLVWLKADRFCAGELISQGFEGDVLFLFS